MGIYTATITLSGTAHSLLEYLRGTKNDGTALSGASKTFADLRGGVQTVQIQALANAQAIYQGSSSEVSSSNNGFTYPVVSSPAMTVYEDRGATSAHNPIDLGEIWLIAASSTPVVNVTVRKE